MKRSGDQVSRADPTPHMDDPNSIFMAQVAEAKELERRAVNLHAASRRRADYFNRPVMADRAMDIMLTAFIAHQQGTVLTRATAAMANRIAAPVAEQIIDELLASNLLQRGSGPTDIRITSFGAELMSKFVENSEPSTYFRG